MADNGTDDRTTRHIIDKLLDQRRCDVGGEGMAQKAALPVEIEEADRHDSDECRQCCHQRHQQGKQPRLAKQDYRQAGPQGGSEERDRRRSR